MLMALEYGCGMSREKQGEATYKPRSFSLSDRESKEIDDAVNWLYAQYGRSYSRSEVISMALRLWRAWSRLVQGRFGPGGLREAAAWLWTGGVPYMVHIDIDGARVPASIGYGMLREVLKWPPRRSHDEMQALRDKCRALDDDNRKRAKAALVDEDAKPVPVLPDIMLGE
jgi:hypothetical protein